MSVRVISVATRRNLATNPKAGAGATTGWTNSSLPTFEAVTLGSGGAPEPSAEMEARGIGTGFHAIANASTDGARLSIAVENGVTYRFSMYVWVVSTAASGCEILVRPTTGAVIGPSYNTLGQWHRLDMVFTATETATWEFEAGSASTAVEWYWTGVLIEQTGALRGYFDGDSVDGEWTGTSNNSASTYRSRSLATLTGRVEALEATVDGGGAVLGAPTTEELFVSVMQPTIDAALTVPVFVAPFALTVEQFSLVAFDPVGGVPASGTDLWVIQVRRWRAGASVVIASSDTNPDAIVYREEWNLDAVTFDASNKVCQKGDIIEVAWTPTGSPAALEQVAMSVRYEPV